MTTPPDKSYPKPSERTANRPRAMGLLVPTLTKDVFGRKNMLFGKMMSEWTHIAGPEIAPQAIPLDLKLSRGKEKNQQGQAVLHLAVQPAFALEFSYQQNLLIERLNAFFGYPAIKEIKIVQNSEVMNKSSKATIKKRILTATEQQKIDQIVGKIEENDLQTALKNLGKAILSRQE